jgi:DNA-binding transcriptional ArsR family regulator
MVIDMPVPLKRQVDQDDPGRALKALSHPMRLKIVKKLLDGESNVAGLRKRLRCAQHKMSRHLAVMRSAGIVQFRVSGPERVYFIPRQLRKISKGSPVLDIGCCRFRGEKL